MPKGYFNYVREKKTVYELFLTVRINMLKTVWADLQAVGKAKQLPVARLILYAIFNEFEQDEPFAFQTHTPDNYVHGENKAVAQKVFDFLAKDARGHGIDILVMSHRDMALTKTECLLGIRELLDDEVLELYRPAGHFDYNPDYFAVRIRRDHFKEKTYVNRPPRKRSKNGKIVPKDTDIEPAIKDQGHNPLDDL